MDKKDYTEPDLREWGSVSEVTETGLTRPGDDLKSGSVGGPKHPPGQDTGS